MTRPKGLKRKLDGLRATYGAGRTEFDPVRFPRSFRHDEDREVVAFIASALAYGRQAHIGRSVEQVLAVLDGRPARYLRRADPMKLERKLGGFSHRFNSGHDVACLLTVLGALLRRYGSLNDAFLAGFDDEEPDVRRALAGFCRRALEADVGPLAAEGRIPPRAGVRFFFSSPSGGSACKRLNMFLRWVVRKDDVDMGLWCGVPASSLVIPLDTHVARVSRELGLSSRKSPDWRMALEVTGSLRELDPEDPVKYDFALFNWGLLRAAGAA